MKNKIKLVLVCSILPFIFCLQASADYLIYDDLIVTYSLCAGGQCADGEDFGFDTVRLKSDNPRIRFYDTSSSANFPTGDWIMGIADGTADPSYFFIDDATADKTVLKLSAGASGGVALGADSELVDNAVSVGSAVAERQIKHVADGIELTDAVNVGQLEQFKSDIKSQLADILARIVDLETRVGNLENP